METLRRFFSKSSDAPQLPCFSASELERILTPDLCFVALFEVYSALALDPETQPKTLGFMGDQGSFHIKAGLYPKKRDVFAAKLNANFPENANQGLPTIQGLVILMDAANGVPLALMDSGELTAKRTAGVAALAASFGARKDSKTLTLVGAGFQADYFLAAFRARFPLRDVYIFDKNFEKAESLARETGARAVRALEGAAEKSDIIVTATTSKTPVLMRSMVKPGAFIAAMGADNKVKNEIEPALFQDAAVLVDDREKCAAEGDLQKALEAGVIAIDQVRGDLCQVVSGKIKARKGGDEIVLFDSVGNGLQDVAVARAVIKRA